MFPAILDLSRRSVVIAGGGEFALRRLRALDEAGGTVKVFAPEPEELLVRAAGERLARRWPEAEDMTGAVVFIAGPERADAQMLTARAHEAGALVNAEDMTDLCDFHVPGIVRRGDMLLTASTGGRAPALARALTRNLAARYGTEWEERLETLARARAGWRAEGLSLREVSERARNMIGEEGWLSQ